MTAETKAVDDDEKSVAFSQHLTQLSQPADSDSEDQLVTQPEDEEPNEPSQQLKTQDLYPNESQSVTQQSQAEGKENEQIRVGDKAFAHPYFQKGGMRYLLCDVIDQRSAKSALDGSEKVQFRCAFESGEFEEQWQQQWRLIPYNDLARRVERALKESLEERKGEALSSIVEEVAETMKVEPEFVEKMARKRKSKIQNKGGNKRIKSSLAK